MNQSDSMFSFANQVREIQDKQSPSLWHYVPTEANPANLVSCGATAEELAEGHWFTGSWMKKKTFASEDDNTQPYTIPPDDLEIKKEALSTKAKEPFHLMLQLQRFSSWHKIKGSWHCV